MLGAFKTGDITILGQRQCTHVILINDISRNIISLGCWEVLHPYNVASLVIKAHNFTFCRAFWWDFLFSGRARSSTLAKSKERSCVPLQSSWVWWEVSTYQLLVREFANRVRQREWVQIEIFEHLFQFVPVILIRLLDTSSQKRNCGLYVTTNTGKKKKLHCCVVKCPCMNLYSLICICKIVYIWIRTHWFVQVKYVCHIQINV